MKNFPVNRDEIFNFSLTIQSGIAANPADFPAPMFDTTPLQTASNALASGRGLRQLLESQLTAAIASERDLLAVVREEEKRLLMLAEAHHRAAPEKLQLIGWSVQQGRAPRRPAGQPRGLVAAVALDGSVTLKWKRPLEGGRPRFYRIERRIVDPRDQSVGEDWGGWQSTVTASPAILTDLPRNVRLTLRVLAINSSGPSTPSNSVNLIL